MNKYKLMLAALVISAYAQAQNEADILRYSQQYNLGTARSQGAGGAFGAVGADYSSTYLNPAGLGLYRRNELHLSAAVTGTLTSGNFLGGTLDESRTNFNIPSFGLVLSKVNTGLNGDADKGIINYNFAFGHNRTNHFQQNIFLEGYNTKSNLSQFFVEQSNGIPSNQISADGTEFEFYNLGWNAYLTDTANNNSTYYSPWFNGDNDYRVKQSQKIEKRGSMDEYNFSGSINIDNILYLGAGLVFNDLRYQYTSVFEESDPDKTVTTATTDTVGNFYRSSYLKTELKTEGQGVAGRFGFIFRPVDFFRFGLSMQTASRINMKDEYQYKVGSDIRWPNIGKVDVESPKGTYEYQLITPARYTASAMLMHPRLGFISVDADMVNYAKGRLTATDFTFSDANSRARASYQEAYQVRVGAELKLKDVYRLRAGYNFVTSPYKNEIPGVSKDDLTRQAYSIGAGYNDGVYFVDLALVRTTFNEFYTPYQLNSGYSPTGKAAHTMINVAVTGGIRF
jgi:hypothetical protein